MNFLNKRKISKSEFVYTHFIVDIFVYYNFENPSLLLFYMNYIYLRVRFVV